MFKIDRCLAVFIFKISCNDGCYILIKHTMINAFKTDICLAVFIFKISCNNGCYSLICLIPECNFVCVRYTLYVHTLLKNVNANPT